MIENLIDLKQKAIKMKICEEYLRRWNEATTPRQLIDMALDSNGMEFMAGTCNTPAGVSSQFLLAHFPEFVNGAYLSPQKGYTAEMFVAQKSVSPRADLVLLLECNGEVTVKPNRCAKIYTDKKCKSLSVGAQKGSWVEVYVFRRDTRVETKGEGVVNVYRMSRTKGLLQWHARKK